MSTVVESSFLHPKTTGSLNSKLGPAAIHWLQPNETVQIKNVKMETLYFSNCYQHTNNPNNFVMAALHSSHKLHGFCIYVKAKNEVLAAGSK